MKYWLLIFCFLVGRQSYCQKNYTITYQSGYFTNETAENLVLNYPPFDLVIRDSVAYCYYTQTPHRDTIKENIPLGSSMQSKFTYYDSQIEIYPKATTSKKNRIVLVERKHTNVNWKLSDEVKDILGYKCKKAEGVRWDMKLEVWYCEDLLPCFGPFIWTGLPGTVLLMVNFTSGLVTGVTNIRKEALPIVEPKFAKRVKE